MSGKKVLVLYYIPPLISNEDYFLFKCLFWGHWLICLCYVYVYVYRRDVMRFCFDTRLVLARCTSFSLNWIYWLEGELLFVFYLGLTLICGWNLYWTQISIDFTAKDWYYDFLNYKINESILKENSRRNKLCNWVEWYNKGDD